MNKPKTINDMCNDVKESAVDGKFVIVPTNMKKIKKGDKTIALPTDVEITNIPE